MQYEVLMPSNNFFFFSPRDRISLKNVASHQPDRHNIVGILSVRKCSDSFFFWLTHDALDSH